LKVAGGGGGDRHEDFMIPKAYYIITLMMEAGKTSETLVNFYHSTWRYNPDDIHLRNHRRENLKSYKGILFSYAVKKQGRLKKREYVQ
jgi:hypothetical protein